MLAKGKIYFAKEDLQGLIGAEGDIILVNAVVTPDDGLEFTFVTDVEIDGVTVPFGNGELVRRTRIR